MWPCWLWPKRLPAPRICKSRIAMRKPDPNDVNSRMAESRLAAISVSTLSRVKVKYAYALRELRPTRPRIWYSWLNPMRSAFSMISVLQLRTSTPVSIKVVQTRMSISLSSNCCHTDEICSSVILPWAMPIRYPGTSLPTRAAHSSMLSTRLCR